MRNRSELFKRYIFFFLGISLNAFGVALFTRSLLGTGPTSCIPYVVSLKYASLSYGTCTFAFNFLLFLIQVILLRKNFPKYQLLQIPVTLFFSIMIDVAMKFTTFVNPNIYLLALGFNLLGCVLRAVGVSCQVVADVVMLSTEAFVKAFSDVTKKEFAVVKLIFDIVMAAIALGLSFILLGRLESVREGTLIIVLVVGPLSHYFTRKLKFTNYVFETETDLVFEPRLKLNDKKRMVVTITSEPGSGGRIIAQILGAKLGLHVYDKSLIDLIAKEGNFSTKFVNAHNEVLYTNAAFAFIGENYSQVDYNSKSYKKLFEAQVQAIHNIVQKENCIIVGRCSNYILRKDPDVINILITADMKHRVSYISEKYNISKSKAHKRIKKQDNNTSEYYRHFTDQDWKDSNNYQLTLDSTLFGYEGTAEIIEDILKKNYMDAPKIKVKDLVTKYQISE